MQTITSGCDFLCCFQDHLIKKNGKRLPYKKFLSMALGVAKGMEVRRHSSSSLSQLRQRVSCVARCAKPMDPSLNPLSSSMNLKASL